MKRQINVTLGLTFIAAMAMALSACSSKDVKSDGLADGATPISPAMASNTDSVLSTNVNDLETVHFAFDSNLLSKEARDTLKRNAEWMKAHPSTGIQIEGNCDERGSVEYNVALGERRANAVKKYLTKLGVDSSRLSIISYGKEHPINPGHDEVAWAENRRATPIKLSPGLTAN